MNPGGGPDVQGPRPAPEDTNSGFHLYGICEVVRLIETWSEMVVVRGKGWRKAELLLSG